ncbi:glycosyltransferase family 4 protein [Pedococcus sp. 5OH_020]|uniref:glycosyltransferase family 4 protein n=1 Tax=Pedococcus sp. 5OH_020 TaxID=2989814 RepID=UPI0022E9E5D0|nr:glycosyltransferase family 1 protein [Pedococcus sp. 5OH_020]
MRVAINLLTDDPANPSGAHWFWTRVIPEMATHLKDDEELRLVVSPRSKTMHRGYGAGVGYVTFPWSNERRNLRTLSEHLYAPVRLPLGGVDVFSTLIAPVVKPAPSLVAHFKTMHAFTAPEAIGRAARLYRRIGYPRTAKVADAIIINSESLRSEVHRHLDVDPAKLRLIPEAVDHDLFRPGDPQEARRHLAERYGVRGPFVLFVSSLWPYKNCDGLLRAFAVAKPDLDGHRLVVVGPGRDTAYLSELRSLAAQLGIADDVTWVGGVPLEETVPFYRAADVFVYPSHNETFGLTILEAMACGCPVVTSDRSAMPETAGGAGFLADPDDPEAIGAAILRARASGEDLRSRGLARAAQFTWAQTARETLEVYREVYANRKARR